MLRTIPLSLAVFFATLFSTVHAEDQAWKDESAKVNANAVTILSGNPNGTDLFLASDISYVIDNGDAMRVMPIVGKGGAHNIRDLIFMRNMDMAIVRSDALEAYGNDPILGDLKDQLRYITRLHNEEMHVLTRKDITSFDQLRGATVNTSHIGSGTQLTSKLVFKRLEIDFKEVNMSQRDGFEALKAGKVDATIIVAGKPARAWSDLEIDTGKFHFVPVPWPESLQDFYLPTTISHEDYPNLIAKGKSVETIAAGALLVTYNWDKSTPRRQRIANFVEHFFSRFDQFRNPARHKKWQEVNIAAQIPGWQRFEPATEWLEKNLKPAGGGARAGNAHDDEIQKQFNAFLTTNSLGKNLSEAERKALFDQFTDWRNANTKLTTTN